MKIFENISMTATLALPFMGLLTNGLPTTQNNLNNPGQQPALLHKPGTIENSPIGSSNMYSAASRNLRDDQQNINLGHPAPNTPINNPDTYASSQNSLSKTSFEKNPINSPTSHKSSIQNSKSTNIWNYSLGSYIQSENFLYSIMNIIYGKPEIKNTITLQNIKKEIVDAKHMISEFKNKVIIGKSELMAAKLDENTSTLKGVYNHFKNNFIRPITEIIKYYSNEIDNGYYAIENLNVEKDFVDYLSEHYKPASLANKQIEYNKILEMFPQDIEKMRYTKGIILNMGELISNTAIILKEIGSTMSINEDHNSPLNTNIDNLLEKSANLLNSLQSFDPNNLDTCINSHKKLISDFKAISNIYINIVKVLSSDIDNYLHKMAKEIVNSENYDEIFNDISKKCVNSLNSLEESLQTAMEQSVVSLNRINELTRNQNSPYNIFENNPKIVNTNDIIADLQKNYNNIANRDLVITPANPSSSSASSNSEDPADSKKNETAIPENPAPEDPSSNSPAAANPEDSPAEDNNSETAPQNVADGSGDDENEGSTHTTPEENNNETAPQNPTEDNNSETVPQKPTEDNNSETVPQKPTEDNNSETTPQKPAEDNNSETVPQNATDGSGNDENEGSTPTKPEDNNNETVPQKPAEGTNSETAPQNPAEGNNSETVPQNATDGSGDDENEGSTHTTPEENNNETAPQNPTEDNNNETAPQNPAEDNNSETTPQNPTDGSGDDENEGSTHTKPEDNNNETAPQNVTDGSGDDENEGSTHTISEENNNETVPQNPAEDNNNETAPQNVTDGSGDDENEGSTHTTPEDNNSETAPQKPEEDNNSETAPQKPAEGNNSETVPQNATDGSGDDENEGSTHTIPEDNNSETVPQNPAEDNNSETVPQKLTEDNNNKTASQNPAEDNNSETAPQKPTEDNNSETAPQNPAEDNNNETAPQNVTDGSGDDENEGSTHTKPEDNNSETAPQKPGEDTNSETAPQNVTDGSEDNENNDKSHDNTQKTPIKTPEEPVTKKTEQENNYAIDISEEKPALPPASIKPELKDTSKTPIQSPTLAINNQEESNTRGAPAKIHENKPSTQEDSNKQPPATATSGSSTSQKNKVPSQTPAISSNEDTLKKASSADPAIPEKTLTIQKNTLPAPALNPSLNANKHESGSSQEARTTSKSSEAPTKPKDAPTMAPEKAPTPATTEATRASARPPFTNSNESKPIAPAGTPPIAISADFPNNKTEPSKTSDGKTQLNRKTEDSPKGKPTNKPQKEDFSTKFMPETPKITEDSSNPCNNIHSASGKPSSMASLPSMIIAGAALYLAHNNR
ncbi:hypothetical protein NEPAR04_0604 [Nematocida parisii]|nr:hypothetical protein NEPAR03_0255 [Nematocida parisii]KAI5126755.1 hypothetical protein NEPAR08_0607 [Nematocida parisii]KAI5140943.1 hypothetical protein NEPAR04_0604 [Nematocida parisii]